MSNVETDPTVVATNEPDVSITAEQAKALGYDSIAALQAKLKKAADTKDSLEKIIPDLTDAIKGFNDNVSALNNEKRQELEAEEFERLSKEKLVETFKGLPADDPKRAEIKSVLLGQYAQNSVELALEGDALTKTLLAPVRKSDPKFEQTQDFRKAWDSFQILTAMRHGINDSGYGDGSLEMNPKTAQHALASLKRLGLPGIEQVEQVVTKALDTVSSHQGADWIPTILSTSVIDEVMVNLNVAPLFRRYTMPSKTFEIPAFVNQTRGAIIDETVGDTAVGTSSPFFTNAITPSGVPSRKVQFVARKYGTVTYISDEIEEDSILPVIDIVQTELQRGLAEGIEDAVINGHYGTTANALNGYFDNAGATGKRLWSEAAGVHDARALFDGLRVMAFKSGITGVDGAPSSSWADEGLNMYRNARKYMGKYGQVNLNDLIWIVGLTQQIELLKLTQLVTVDKYGPGATVLSGEIGKIDGIPIVVSPFIYENLDSYGCYTDGTAVTYGAGNGSLTGATSAGVSNKTMSLLVNRRVAGFADRRLTRVESDRQPLAGQRYIMATSRFDFKKLYPDTEDMIGYVRNLGI